MPHHAPHLPSTAGPHTHTDSQSQPYSSPNPSSVEAVESSAPALPPRPEAPGPSSSALPPLLPLRRSSPQHQQRTDGPAVDQPPPVRRDLKRQTPSARQIQFWCSVVDQVMQERGLYAFKTEFPAGADSSDSAPDSESDRDDVRDAHPDAPPPVPARPSASADRAKGGFFRLKVTNWREPITAPSATRARRDAVPDIGEILNELGFVYRPRRSAVADLTELAETDPSLRTWLHEAHMASSESQQGQAKRRRGAVGDIRATEDRELARWLRVVDARSQPKPKFLFTKRRGAVGDIVADACPEVREYLTIVNLGDAHPGAVSPPLLPAKPSKFTVLVEEPPTFRVAPAGKYWSSDSDSSESKDVGELNSGSHTNEYLIDNTLASTTFI